MSAQSDGGIIGLILVGFGWSSLVRAKKIEEWAEMALDLQPYDPRARRPVNRS